MHAKLHPALLLQAAKRPGLPRWARGKDLRGHVRLVLVLRPKGGTAQPPTEEFLASFRFSNLAFLFKFQCGMHCLSIALVVEFHSLSIIGFMTDLFSFSFFFPFSYQALAPVLLLTLSYTVNHVLLSIV